MIKEQEMVGEFHTKFGFTQNKRPTQIDPELGEVRHGHTLEEMEELLKADHGYIGTVLGLNEPLYTLPKELVLVFVRREWNVYHFRPKRPEDMKRFGHILKFTRKHLLKLKVTELTVTKSARELRRK